MTTKQTQRLTGMLLILGAVAVNIPYAMLIKTFDYPDILRAPTADILTRFASGGSSLIWNWMAFAWVGLPILLGILLLPKALAGEASPLRGRHAGNLALIFGAAGAIAQMLGLLRWVFVVPVLARMYTASQASSATREAVVIVFQAVHQYGGVVLGEHIGQTFTILWMILLSISLLQQGILPQWISWAGFITAFVYILAQAELLATVLPDFPVWEPAGQWGSLLWLAWMIALGILLLRTSRNQFA